MAEEELCQQCYLESYLPTQYSEGPWLHVSNEEDRVPNSQSKRFIDSRKFKRVWIEERKIKIFNTDESQDEVELTPENIDKIALDLNDLIGKWLIYGDEANINATWLLIGKATINGELGLSSKVSTALSRKKQFVICVYTWNYLEEENVMRVRSKLFALGFQKTLYYKPDIYTKLGIYPRTTHLVAYKYKK